MTPIAHVAGIYAKAWAIFVESVNSGVDKLVSHTEIDVEAEH